MTNEAQNLRRCCHPSLRFFTVVWSVPPIRKIEALARSHHPFTQSPALFQGGGAPFPQFPSMSEYLSNENTIEIV